METMMPESNSIVDRNLGVVEVIDRSGNVVQRVEVDQNSVSIGRGYGNDIILDDPYICLEHVSVMVEDGMLLIKDLDSVNGIFQNKSHSMGEQLKLDSNDTFKIGHTTLRYRSFDTHLQPTKIDRHIRNSFWSFHNPIYVLLAFLIMVGFVLFETIFFQTEETENVKILADMIPVIATILTWAGLWALFGKLIIGKFSFGVHVGIFSVANIAFYLCPILLGYLCYAIGFDQMFSILVTICIAVIVVWMLYSHLSYSTKKSFRSILTTSVVLTMMGVGFYLLQIKVMQSEFSYIPSYNVVIKSPDFNFVSGESLDSFFSATKELKDSVSEAKE